MMKIYFLRPRQLYILFCAALFVAIVCLLQPIGTTIIRALTVASMLTIWSIGLYLCWQKLPLRIVSLGLTLSIVAFLLAPDRAISTASLRDTYVQALRSYEGTTYVWGGENHRGIDCSGLVRAASSQANLTYGIKSIHPSLVRRALSLWWFDLSALALRDGARGWTDRLFRADSINQILSTQIRPGDLAATADGEHILAFLGGNKWIEADPAIGKVIIVQTPEPNNIWFQVPVYVLRWQQLT